MLVTSYCSICERKIRSGRHWLCKECEQAYDKNSEWVRFLIRREDARRKRTRTLKKNGIQIFPFVDVSLQS